MKNYIPLLILLFFFLLPVLLKAKKVKEKILFALTQQEEAWNKGDIEGYMAYYWNSDSLKFIGKSGVTTGWDSTLEHYKKAYPDTIAMGKLTFGEINIMKLSRHHILVKGSWKLTRVDGNMSGYYSLIWKKIKGKWLIIIDHTS